MDAATKSEASAQLAALRDKFIALAGSGYARSATAADAVAGVHPKLVVEPGTEQELAEILRLSSEASLAVIPRGGGTKLGWGVLTSRLSKIIEHAWADLTVSAEAGCTIQKLQETLAQHGQRLALDPLWPRKATIGGVLSTNDSGALRLRFGALRDLIIGVTIALPDGTLASSGGKVVKNVAGYDLPKLVTGALGTLGVITRAVFRLHPLPRNTRSFSISTADGVTMQQFVLAVQNSKLAHTSLQSHFSSDASPVSDILFEGTEAGLAAQEVQLRKLSALATTAKIVRACKLFGGRHIKVDGTRGALGVSRFRRHSDGENQYLAGKPGAYDGIGETRCERASSRLEIAGVCNGPRMAAVGR